MKHSNLCLFVAASTLLCSCVNLDNFDDIDSSSEISSSVTSLISSSSTSSISSSWKEDVQEEMEDYLGFTFDLPLPKGLTDSYQSSEVKDSNTTYFKIVDKRCGDITSSYCEELIESGFSQKIGASSLSYYKQVEEEDRYVVVAPSYSNEEGMVILINAEEAGLYCNFPYADIASYFNKEKVSNTEIPSFGILSGCSYSVSSLDKVMVISGDVLNGDSTLNSYVKATGALGYDVSFKDGVMEASSLAYGYSLTASYLSDSTETEFVLLIKLFEQETTWNSDDLSRMASVLGSDNVIPFPVDVQYPYYTGTSSDNDGDYFYCLSDGKDFRSSYEKQLTSSGFALDSSSDYSSSYCKSTADKKSLIVKVTYDPDRNGMDIYAWVKIEEDNEAKFPYEEIAKALGFDSLSSTELPAFKIKEGSTYDCYSTAGHSPYYVGGYVELTSTSDIYHEKYVTELENRGYEITMTELKATSTAYNLKLYFALFETYKGNYFLLTVDKLNK